MQFLTITFLCASLALSSSLWATPGVVVLAGGDSEGDIGVKTDWSYSLYKRLVENGDTTGDKKIKVVVLSLEKPSTNFIADYFKSMGADSSYNLVVSSRKAANDPRVTQMMKDADVVFIRGGNQGKAYQLWKGTRVHEEIKKLGERGGAIGGTSSGSMGLSEYSITGGMDFDSREVLANSTSVLLNDEKAPMKSGIHNDFLNMAPGLLVDTHCGVRGRVGRLMATLAKATDDFKNKNIIGVCLEEKTGIAIEKGKARVYGTGTAHFLTETKDTKKVREHGRPLTYVNVREDALTDGWIYRLAEKEPDLASAPKSTVKISPEIDCAFVSKTLSLKGKSSSKLSMTNPQFSSGLTVFEDAYSDAPIMIAGDPKKGVAQTKAYERLAKSPNESVILLDSSSELRGTENNHIMVKNEKTREAISTLILDCKACTHTSKSPYVALLDTGNQSLHSTGIVNMRVHVIAPGDKYNVETHEVTLAKDVPYKSLEDCFVTGLGQGELNQLIEDEKLLFKATKCKK